MYEFDLARLKAQVEEGETLEPHDAARLLEEIAAWRKRVGQPTELHITVSVDPDDPSRWTAHHPLLRSEVKGTSASNALILAALELRRGSAVDDEVEDPVGWRADRARRAEWAALAEGDEPAASALADALVELTAVERELHDLRESFDDYQLLRGPTLPGKTDAQRRAATARLRAHSLASLRAAGVTGFEHEWATAAFGSATDYGIPLPVLVLAVDAHSERKPLLPGVFEASREWFAISHRTSDGVSVDYLYLVASPLAVSNATDKALRRLPLLVPDRARTIDHLRAYVDAVDDLLGGQASVGAQHGPVGGGCWPFDIENIEVLTGGEIRHEELAALVDRGGQRLWFGPRWRLLLLGSCPDDRR